MSPREQTDPRQAIWSVSIDTECPECGTDFDITQAEDFWGEEGRDLKLAQDAVLETRCPQCGHEFNVRCEW